jgi:hypothetical protein
MSYAAAAAAAVIQSGLCVYTLMHRQSLLTVNANAKDEVSVTDAMLVAPCW